MTKSSRNRKARGGRSAAHPVRCAYVSQAGVRTVAERLAAGRLAAAEPDFLGRLGGERDRGQPGALVRAVAERLVGAAPAGAPEIALAGLDGDAVGLFLRGYRFGHDFFPAVALAKFHALRRRGRATVGEPSAVHKPGRGGSEGTLMAVYTDVSDDELRAF